MKKTALHFKIAAWSIKNPVQFYAVVAGIFVVMLCSLLMLGRASIKLSNATLAVNPATKVESGSVVPNSSNSTANPPQWVSGPEFRQGALRCLERKRIDTGYKVFSCYENVNGQWLFKYNL